MSHLFSDSIATLLDHLKEKLLKIQKLEEFNKIFSSNGFNFRGCSFYKIEDNCLIGILSIKYNLKYEIITKSKNVFDNIPNFTVKIEMEVNRDSKNNLKVMYIIFKDLSTIEYK